MIRFISTLLLVTLVLTLTRVSSAADRATVTLAVDQTAYVAGGSGRLAIVFDIPPGFHAQSHRPLKDNYIAYNITPNATDGINFEPPAYPPGKIEAYPGIGKMSVYSGKVITIVPFRVASDASPGVKKLSVKVTYQICDDAGTCQMPQRPVVEQSIDVTPTAADVSPANAELFSNLPATEASTPQTEKIDAREDVNDFASPAITGFGSAAMIALLAGLIFNVMPCVLPVLPLKAIGFYEAAGHDRLRSFGLGLMFACGTITVFALLAVPVLVLKLINWGEIFSKWWFIYPLVALLIVMAISLFGAGGVTLPTAVYRFAPRHDTPLGNFGWGAFTAVLATPCTAPLFPPLLLWAAQQQAVIAVLLMVLVGVGMAMPYVFLSAFPALARRLPRVGPWSELFRQMLGFPVLAAAVYFGAGHLISGNGFLWLVVLIIAVGAVYLVARTVQLSDRAGAIAVSSTIAVLLLGGSFAWASRLTNEVGQWEPYSVEAVDTARAKQVPVLVKFTANWCANCQVIEGTVFKDATVWRELEAKNFVMLKADLTRTIDDPAVDPLPLLNELNPSGGIPLTAIYLPGRDRPIILSSVYTAETLRGIISKIKE